MSSSVCPGCRRRLKEPYIKCAQCQPAVNICLPCFSSGKEFYSHLNSHSYEIKSTAFSLFAHDWTSDQELQLLTNVHECGIGNWTEIAKKVKGKTSTECKNHYIAHYIEEPKSESLPQFNVNREVCFRRPLAHSSSVVPPRPDASKPDDLLFPAGYSCTRGDFATEYDDYAESDVKDVGLITESYYTGCADTESEDEEEDEQTRKSSKEDEVNLWNEMNVAVTDIYLTVTQDRKLRKRIVKKYGLLGANQPNNNACAYSKHELNLRDRLKPFCRLMKAESLEKLVQGIVYQRYLEARIKRMQQHRKMGLTTLLNGQIYERLNRRRHLFKPRISMLDNLLPHIENPDHCNFWLERQLAGYKPNHPLLNRKAAAPLDITKMDGFDQLNATEREFCSTVRLNPSQYLEIKQALMKESEENSGITLQWARSMIKIDVNKIRKLFDFMLNNEMIKTKE